jgi:hypothetical protein
MKELKTLYVRIQQRQQATRFYRCGMEFGRAWKKVSDLDAATAQRLEEEQMLEVTDQRPADFEEDASAGDSAAVEPKPPVTGQPPASAPVKPTDPVELAAAIKAAVNAMDQDNADLWTAGGKPKTESIAAITGWPVSAAERDAALLGA